MHPEAFDFPGFRVALAIASSPGMTIELCTEFLGHHTSECLRWMACQALIRANKLQDIAVKRLGLFPVDRVRGFGQDDEFGAGDMGELAAHDPGRRLQVLIAGHQQCRHANRRELFERDRRALGLRRHALLLELS